MAARLVAAVIVVSLAACTGHREASTTVAAVTPAVTAAASVTPAVTAAATETASPGTPTPAPTPTVDPNLLSLANGAIIRQWTVVIGATDAGLVYGSLYQIDPKYARPVSLLYELPSVAHIDRFGAVAGAQVPVTFRFEAGTSRSALSGVGTITAPPNSNNAEESLNVNVNARYVRVTVDRQAGNGNTNVFRIAAYGTPGSPESGSLGGWWISADPPHGENGTMFGSVKGEIPESLPADAKGVPRLAVVQNGVLEQAPCWGLDPPWRGTISNNVAIAPDGGRVQLAGDGKLLVGPAGWGSFIAMRSAKPAAPCVDSVSGRGPMALVLYRAGQELYTESDPEYAPGFRYHRFPVLALDASTFRGADFAILDEVCDAPHILTTEQQQLLLNWVQAGHKLIVRDSDPCRSSDYSFIPYPFTTTGSTASGAKGHVLRIADPSALGAGPSDPAHFLDTAAYVASNLPDLGDADVMQTEDLHWCGLILATNVTGATGWVRAYARYGRGLIIYDGLDRDDLKDHLAPAVAATHYEYALPVQAELPCNNRVASALVIYPSVDRKLAAGTPSTLRADLFLANGDKPGSSRNVALTISGDVNYRAAVSPTTLDAPAGKAIPVVATIELPKGWSGVHAFTVTADGGGGVTGRAQTTIRIDGSIALANAFMKLRRVRVYGIHFDVDSAHIQPQSEATVAQIAQVLRVNPSWHMRVEGYTDSDGGAAYNLGLSERRAQSVVNDLVTRYGISRSRLMAAGYGLTHPVATNDTEAGKALNRRVELVRL
jgi:hypothetical protein